MADEKQTAEELGKLPVPEISDELIAWLRAMHPERCIGKNETEVQAHRRAGMQDLIDKLTIYNRLQAKYEAGDFADEDERSELASMLVWEAPTKEQEDQGFVLRIS